MHCSICKRLLNNPDDPLSEDLGGDCGYCMLGAEAQVGDMMTVADIAAEISLKAVQLAARKAGR